MRRGSVTGADVIVVGAGPAGAAAACFLADAGASVVLLDRRRFPREKPCGEGILPPGVEVLERLGIADALRNGGARAFRGIRYHAPGGRTAIGAFPTGGSGLGVRRRVLDAALLDAARSRKNVRVVESAPVSDIVRDAEGAVAGVTDGDRTWTAKLTIAADGNHSVIRHKAGLDGAATTRNAVRLHFRPVVPPPDSGLVDVYVGGATEAYVTPVAPGEYGVAFLVDGAFPRSAEDVAAPGMPSSSERMVRRALACRDGIAHELHDAPATSEPMSAVGVGETARACVADGLLLLGDAAGSPDPITGMGISFALRCASLLPATLADAFRADDFSAARLQPYVRARRREVAGGFAVTRGVRWLAARDARAEIAIRTLRRAPALFTSLFRLAS
jgi:2-polyprenyl-6-methoxyphenol hydroxylase-like FAD-dependent oxidoreductase